MVLKEAAIIDMLSQYLSGLSKTTNIISIYYGPTDIGAD